LPDETAFSRGEAVAYRAYRDAAGRVVTLVVAYGSAGGDSVRLHRPESCYVAQGYEIDDRSVARVVRGDVAVPTVRLTARSPSRKEAVSYWIRNGADFVTEAAQAQFLAFHKGQERDSALVRLSSTGDDPELFRIHEAFFAVFTEGLSQPARRLLLGAEETSV
jgi:EpsI family protein